MGFLAAAAAAVGTAFATAGTAAVGGTVTAAAAASAATTLTAVSAGVAAAGVAYSAYASNQAHKYQAQVAANNAKIADYNANQTIEQGNVEESAQHGLASRRVGAAIAAQGANNVDTTFGTAAQVQQGLQNSGDLDAMTIRYNSAQRALGFINQGQGYTAESSMQRAAATNAGVEGVLGVGSTLISGATSMAKSKLGFLQYTGGA